MKDREPRGQETPKGFVETKRVVSGDTVYQEFKPVRRKPKKGGK